MVQQYAPPVNVSPTIRLTRWGFLAAGIIYGALWNSRYTSYEKKMRPVWDQQKAERDAYLKAENERKSKVEMDELAKLAEPTK